MARAKSCLKLYYEPDMTGADRAGVLDAFGRALREFPVWAVSRAFDAWERDGKRRPSPGDIAELARREVRRLREEVEDRAKAAVQEPPVAERTDIERARAAEILERAGFTPKRAELLRRNPEACTLQEAEEAHDRVPHWSDTEAPDSPAMRALEQARSENPIIKAARAAQAKRDSLEQQNDGWQGAAE